MARALTSLELRLVDSVLGMEDGYVLDFSDRTFREFFQDLDIDIDDPIYLDEGRSKARRLRRLLRISNPEVAGRVLEALLDYRLEIESSTIPEAHLAGLKSIIERLRPPKPADDPQESLQQRSFDPKRIEELPLSRELIALLCSRISEAERCLQIRAHLSVVILCGSVLEGLCLGFVMQHAEAANQEYLQLRKKQAPPLKDWNLATFIDVLHSLKVFSSNIQKFSHSVREFRNFVHPNAELRDDFAPDHHSAKIAFQVVLAAVDDITKAVRNTTKMFND